MRGRKIRNPRVEASAYRIWAWATPQEWRVNVIEIAEALELPVASVQRICVLRGWSGRLSSTSHAEYHAMRQANLGLEVLTRSTDGALVRDLMGEEVW